MTLTHRVANRPAATGLIQDTRGLAAVELALVLPILVLLLGGVIDFSRFATQRLQVKAAAQAGADYVLRKGWNASAVINSISGSTSLEVDAFPGPQLVMGCLSGSAVVETSNLACANGTAPGRYVVISARATFTPLMPWPRTVLPTTLEGAAFARVE